MSARITVAASAWAGTSRSDPPNAPTAVRTGSQITASRMSSSPPTRSRCYGELRDDRDRRDPRPGDEVPDRLGRRADDEAPPVFDEEAAHGVEDVEADAVHRRETASIDDDLRDAFH